MNFLSKGNYVAIEGVIGVGKTTLSSIIAKKFNGREFLEIVEKNPFLEDFYVEPDKYAFQLQLFFLLSRFKQQEELLQMDLFSKFIVSDYFFEKDRIFAYLNLSEKELGLYEILWTMLARRVSNPDLVIYLQAETDTLMERIIKRGRIFERDMDREYIERLNQAYNYFFFHYNKTNLLLIKTDEIDFVEDDTHLKMILNEIQNFQGGRKYFDPLKVK
jgi:deoxyadenosine/deoxycytidine kinase